jgi:hypothetical protein
MIKTEVHLNWEEVSLADLGSNFDFLLWNTFKVFQLLQLLTYWRSLFQN